MWVALIIIGEYLGLFRVIFNLLEMKKDFAKPPAIHSQLKYSCWVWMATGWNHTVIIPASSLGSVYGYITSFWPSVYPTCLIVQLPTNFKWNSFHWIYQWALLIGLPEWVVAAVGQSRPLGSCLKLANCSRDGLHNGPEVIWFSTDTSLQAVSSHELSTALHSKINPAAFFKIKIWVQKWSFSTFSHKKICVKLWAYVLELKVMPAALWGTTVRGTKRCPQHA